MVDPKETKEKIHGLHRLREEKEMAERANGEVSQETGIEASGDAIAIADSIYAGLTEIARAITLLAKNGSVDEEEPVLPRTYLDGSPINE